MKNPFKFPTLYLFGLLFALFIPLQTHAELFEKLGTCSCSIFKKSDMSFKDQLEDFVSLKEKCPEVKEMMYKDEEEVWNCEWKEDTLTDIVPEFKEAETFLNSFFADDKEVEKENLPDVATDKNSEPGSCLCDLVNPLGESVGSGTQDLSKEECKPFEKEKVGKFDCKWVPKDTNKLGSTDSNFLASVKDIDKLNQLSSKDIPTLIGNIIAKLMGVIGSIALIMIVYGGFTAMTAAGSEEKVKKGTEILVWSTLGLVVIFASYAIVDLVFEAFR